jgi:DNA repair exonuclease SbcCD ATPase subunit
MKLSDVRKQIERLQGAKSLTEKQITAVNDDLAQLNREYKWCEQAREIVREVGMKTQEQLQYHISDITSLALESIFDDPYELKVEFVQRRNKTECDLLFVRDGETMKPVDSSGGGTVDVASFALRIASWSMSNPRTRNTIILDEPLRFLSVDNQERASRMIKELSDKLGLQFIIISHEEELAAYADKEFKVSIRDGISKVIENGSKN